MTDMSAMRKLPKREIWASVESMQRDLDKAYKELQDVPYDTPSYLLALIRVRTLSEEILRWLVL